VDPLNSLFTAIRQTLAQWWGLDLGRMSFGESRAAVLLIAVLAALALLMLLARSLRPRNAGRARVALPALPAGLGSSGLSMTRHAPLLLFLLGIPFFAFALADPYTALTEQNVSHPGRRIAVMIDASLSMNQPFVSEKLNSAKQPTYFATVAAAEYFMRLRMGGPQRDLVSLIEFGNEAYVVTPFTTDYDNVLVSMRLISQPTEWDRFPDQGTAIIQAIQQAMKLFAAFNFLDASGNLIVIFSDGQDTQTAINGLSVEKVMAEARRHKIPVYFIRMAYNKALGGVETDAIWRNAIERTGGKFFPGTDEKTILRAVHEIDQLAPGRIDIRRYVVEQTHFAAYALIAVLLWMAAATLKLGLRAFRSFP
jgi:hypothetical protein